MLDIVIYVDGIIMNYYYCQQRLKNVKCISRMQFSLFVRHCVSCVCVFRGAILASIIENQFGVPSHALIMLSSGGPMTDSSFHFLQHSALPKLACCVALADSCCFMLTIGSTVV